MVFWLGLCLKTSTKINFTKVSHDCSMVKIWCESNFRMASSELDEKLQGVDFFCCERN